MKHKHRITPELFERWLNLWKKTTDELMPPDAAHALQAKAARIAESLQLAMFFRLDRRPGPAGNSQAAVCYALRSAPIEPHRFSIRTTLRPPRAPTPHNRQA